MEKQSFKDLVLANFPELTVKRDVKYPQLFVMFNKNGNEVISSLSAKQVWEHAHKLMLLGEFKPYWLEDHEKSKKEANEMLIKAKKDPNWKPSSLTDQEIDELVNRVLKKHSLIP